MLESIQLSNDIIGNGAYGVVKKGYLDNTECAVKIIHSELLKGYSKSKFLLRQMTLHEAKVMSKLAEHPNLVQLKGLYQPSNEGRDSPPYLVMEFCHKGNLRSNIKDPAMYDLLTKLHILLDTAEGLKYMHSCGFLHGDLTPQNIFITKQGKAKIGDFGATKSSNGTNLTDSIPGTPGYMGPEIQGSHHSYNEKLDIYSFGCVVLFTISTGEELTDDIKKWLEYLSPWPLLRELAEQCLQPDPQKRPKADEICQQLSCYITNIEKWLEYFSQWPLLQELAKQCLHCDPRKGPTAGKTSKQLCHIMQMNFDAICNISSEKLHLKIIQNGYELTHPGVNDVLSSLVHSFGMSEMMVPRHINKSCAVSVLCEQLCKLSHDGHTVNTPLPQRDCMCLSSGYDKPFNSSTNACYDETDIAVAILGLLVCCLLYSLESLLHTCSFDDSCRQQKSDEDGNHVIEVQKTCSTSDDILQDDYTCSKQQSDEDENQVIEVQNMYSASDDIPQDDDTCSTQQSDEDENQVIEVQNMCSASDDILQEDEPSTSEYCHEEPVACELHDSGNDGKSSVVSDRRLSFHNGCNTRPNTAGIKYLLLALFSFIGFLPFISCSQNPFLHLEAIEHLLVTDLNNSVYIPIKVLLCQLDVNYLPMMSDVYVTDESSMLPFYRNDYPQCKLQDYSNNETFLYNSLICDDNSIPNYSAINASLNANEMNADHLHLESFAMPNLSVSQCPFLCAHHMHPFVNVSEGILDANHPLTAEQNDASPRLSSINGVVPKFEHQYCEIQVQDTSITLSNNSSNRDNSLLLNKTVNSKLIDDGKGFLFKTAARISQLVTVYSESQPLITLPAKHTNPLDHSFTRNQTMLLYNNKASLLMRNDFTCTIKFEERTVPNATNTLELRSEQCFGKVSGPLHYNNGSYSQPYREIERYERVAIDFYEVLNAVITFNITSVVNLTSVAKPLLLYDNLMVNAVIVFKFSIDHFPNIKNTHVNFLYWLHNTFIIVTLYFYIYVKWLVTMVLISECTKRKLQLWIPCCTFHNFKIQCLKNIAYIYNVFRRSPIDKQLLREMVPTSGLAGCLKYRHSVDTLYLENSIEQSNINSNIATASTRQSKVVTIQKKHWTVTINSTEETSGKYRCIKELDNWLFQQKVIEFHGNAYRIFSLFLSPENKHTLISTAASRRLCLSKSTSGRNLDIYHCQQLSRAKSMEAKVENENFHYEAREDMITVFTLHHYKHRHWDLFTQHVQVISHQHCLQYNVYSCRMQALAVVNITECADQPLCQISVSISVKMVQVKVMQNKQYIFYDFSLQQRKDNFLTSAVFSDRCSMLQIMTNTQEERCHWFVASEMMLQVLHQCDVDLFNAVSQLKACYSHFEFKDDVTAFDLSFGLQDFQHSFPPDVTSMNHHNSHYTYGLDQSCRVIVASNEEDQHYQDRNQLSSDKHQNNKSVTKDQRKDTDCNTQHKHNDSEGERHEKDSNGSDRACILNPALFNTLSLLRCILPLLLMCLILLSLPSRSFSQPAIETEHHNCNHVIVNTPLLDVSKESTCQLGWIGKNCHYKMLMCLILLSLPSRSFSQPAIETEHHNCNHVIVNTPLLDVSKESTCQLGWIGKNCHYKMLMCLILLSLPSRSFSQLATETEHHNCNHVIVNTPLLDVSNESTCQLGWIGKNCHYKMLYPYVEPSVIVTYARLSTTTQSFYQGNLHVNKEKQIGIVNDKPFTNLYSIAVLHNLQLLTPIKYQLQVKNLDFRCNMTVVLIICGEQLQPVTLKMSRTHRLTSLPQYFDWEKSTLQIRMLSCSMLDREVTACSLHAETDMFNHDLLCNTSEFCGATHGIFNQIYHHFHTGTFGTSIQHSLLWCRTHNGTLNNTAVSYSLSERCGIFVQKMIQQLMTYPTHTIHNNENSSRDGAKRSNTKCNANKLQHNKIFDIHLQRKEHGSYHSNVVNTKNISPLYFLLLLQLLLLIQLLWLSSGPRISNDAILVNNSLTKEICISSINRKTVTYQFHAMFRQNPPIIIDVWKDELNKSIITTHCKLLLTCLQVSKYKTVYPQLAIGTYFKLYRETVVTKQGLILIQQQFDTIRFDYKVSEFKIRCLVYLQARHSIPDFHNVNRIMHRLMCNNKIVGRLLLYRTHRWIFHIENNVLKYSTSQLHTILIQWTSNLHKIRILHQSSSYFRRHFYGLGNAINYSLGGISELTIDTTINHCFQENTADTLGSQNAVLHSTRTIPTLAKENTIDAFRPINIASGRTINYYSYQGLEDGKDMFDTWQLVIGHTTLYSASGVAQILLNEQHHEIIYGDNIIANFVNENFDVAILPEQPELANNYNDNIVIVSY